MKTIKPDELFQSLNDFLKGKGIELKEGVYAQGIRRACNLLGEAINATQNTAKKAKDGVDKKLEQVRQSIHEATAPKPPVVPTPEQEARPAPAAQQETPVTATATGEVSISATPVSESALASAATERSRRTPKASKARPKRKKSVLPAKKARKK